MASKGKKSRPKARQASRDLRAFAEQVWMAGLHAVGQQLTDTRRRASRTRAGFEKALQLRVQQAMGQLGVPTADEISALSRKVEQLNQSVLELTRQRRGARRSLRHGSRTGR
jgi:hypothetical protein